MAHFIPERDAAGVIIGMRRAEEGSQVATLLEETMKAVGATSSSAQHAAQAQRHPSKQRSQHAFPALDTRTIAALVVLALLFILMLFAVVTQVSVRPSPPPTIIIPVTQQTYPTTTPSVIPDAPTPIPEPVEPGVPPESEPGALAVPQEPEPVEAVAPEGDVQATPDKQATVDAWVEAPVSTSTPLPQPGEPGFAESFQPEPECNLFIGYVGPKRAHCQAVYATQTAETDGP